MYSVVAHRIATTLMTHTNAATTTTSVRGALKTSRESSHLRIAQNESHHAPRNDSATRLQLDAAKGCWRTITVVQRVRRDRSNVGPLAASIGVLALRTPCERQISPKFA
ncbi:hypothetical protein [Rhodopseudomonas palustris]|uniref:hypothetical protein n=1 Tax=Rhodopseudomonas palustris TaxID=1076 RepID=UPI00131C9260|nr:hypothetical protein [Rhodopseudomonas palustris]